MKKIHIDILILGDENSTIALKLGSMKRLGDQYTIATQHRPCSAPGATKGFDLIILDACNEDAVVDSHRVQRETVDICRQLRGETSAIILLFSFIDDEDYATDAYNSGVDGFIAMPIMLPLLIAKLQAWLRWRVPVTIDDIQTVPKKHRP